MFHIGNIVGYYMSWYKKTISATVKHISFEIKPSQRAGENLV